MDISLVRAKSNDAEQYKNLRLTMLHDDPLTNPYLSYEKAIDMSEYDWQNEFNFFMNNDNGILLFAKVGDEYAGFFTATFSSNTVDHHSVLLSKLYVLQKYRGLGIGKKLFEGIITEVLKNKFVKKMRLYVTETQKKAIEMYKKHDFQETGRHVREIFINGRYYDDLIMEKFIN
jgi:ribosomal protein S18 acetylase RimI-like enzyme